MSTLPTLRCGLALRDRVALAPLTNTQSHADGTLSDDELTWLRARAEGGFRWISTCAAHVSEEGHAWEGQLGVASEAHVEGLTRLATALREAGAHSVVQLYHGGARATLAPDKLTTADGDGVRGATAGDLARVQADFVAAAVRSEAAGFDGVEIHGANGYLFTQFLAPEDNPRTDAWGGDLAGRAKLLLDTLRAVRAAVSPGFAVGVRLSPVDTWWRRGLVLADGAQVARWVAEAGADFVHLSLSDAAGSPPHEDTDVPVARVVRDALPPEVPLFAAGGIWTRADAARAHDAGVDVVVLGRSAIAHPDWPRVSSASDFEPLRPPWPPEHLSSVAVGPDLLRYLEKFPGMVVGGTPARE
ncbi:MAG: NADH:flavin oxidoreductase [Myxococcales bacterium]|nr:NADH:flavin oxidoreductase [Myxococcales bacterium]